MEGAADGRAVVRCEGTRARRVLLVLNISRGASAAYVSRTGRGRSWRKPVGWRLTSCASRSTARGSRQTHRNQGCVTLERK